MYSDDDEDDFEEDDWEAEEPCFKRYKLENSRSSKCVQNVKKKNMPLIIKEEILRRIENSSSDKDKILDWVENALKLPFGKHVKLPVNKNSSAKVLAKFFAKVNKTLDNAVHGMSSVKEEVLNYIAQFISTNSESMPRILGLCGSPGIGKTAIIRKGFAEALNRPMVCLSMGGVRDSSFFLGHDYTYIGSKYGCLAQSLIKLNCMNGIIFLDEIDKVSDTSEGHEIQNLLLHITDPMQNHAFQDKYFAGLDLDLSKIIFVFSYNHEKMIDPVLRDRIYTIKVPDPTLSEKIVIAQKYLLKDIEVNVGFKAGDIVITSEVVESIVRTYCKGQQGVRGLKKCLENLLLKVNTARYLQDDKKYKCFQKKLEFPFTITQSVADELLVECKPAEDKYLSSMYI